MGLGELQKVKKLPPQLQSSEASILPGLLAVYCGAACPSWSSGARGHPGTGPKALLLSTAFLVDLSALSRLTASKTSKTSNHK